MTTEEKLVASEPVILFTINRTYQCNMTDCELYEATRKSWGIGPRREGAKYAVATYWGNTLEAYEIHEWCPVPYEGERRWAFRGEIADDEIRHELVGRSVKHLREQGNASPFLYSTTAEIGAVPRLTTSTTQTAGW